MLDPFSRCVIGWSILATMTSQLATETLLMSVCRDTSPAKLAYFDEGSPFTSRQF